MKGSLKARPAQAQHPQRAIDSPYLSAHEAVIYLRLGSLSALYRLINEHRLPFGRLGRSYRFDKRELDAFVKGFGSALEMVRSTRSA